MASSKEIFQAIKILKNGTSKIILLKCTSITQQLKHLNTIIEMRKIKCIIGISDRARTSVPLASVVRCQGYREDFKLPNDKSLDSHFSIDFGESSILKPM